MAERPRPRPWPRRHVSFLDKPRRKDLQERLAMYSTIISIKRKKNSIFQCHHWYIIKTIECCINPTNLFSISFICVSIWNSSCVFPKPVLGLGGKAWKPGSYIFCSSIWRYLLLILSPGYWQKGNSPIHNVIFYGYSLKTHTKISNMVFT